MFLGVNVSSILFFMPKCFHVHTAKTAMLLLLSLKLIFMRPSLYAQHHHNQFWRKTKSKHCSVILCIFVAGHNWDITRYDDMLLYLFQIMLHILLSQFESQIFLFDCWSRHRSVIRLLMLILNKYGSKLNQCETPYDLENLI